MAPVTPVFMRVLRPRCYRTSHAVYGIAAHLYPLLQYHLPRYVTGLVMPFTALLTASRLTGCICLERMCLWMPGVFVNHTNHPSARWDAQQLMEAESFGTVVDVPFPEVPADASEEDVQEMVQEHLAEILALHPAAVLCQGEFTYTYLMIHQLLLRHIPVLAACSERQTEERHNADGSTTRVSHFIFRQYRRFAEYDTKGGKVL